MNKSVKIPCRTGESNLGRSVSPRLADFRFDALPAERHRALTLSDVLTTLSETLFPPQNCTSHSQFRLLVSHTASTSHSQFRLSSPHRIPPHILSSDFFPFHRILPDILSSDFFPPQNSTSHSQRSSTTPHCFFLSHEHRQKHTMRFSPLYV